MRELMSALRLCVQPVGESDSAIVAAKSTNKVERSAAEPLEPRAGAAGNASW